MDVIILNINTSVAQDTMYWNQITLASICDRLCCCIIFVITLGLNNIAANFFESTLSVWWWINNIMQMSFQKHRKCFLIGRPYEWKETTILNREGSSRIKDIKFQNIIKSKYNIIHEYNRITNWREAKELWWMNNNGRLETVDLWNAESRENINTIFCILRLLLYTLFYDKT